MTKTGHCHSEYKAVPTDRLPLLCERSERPGRGNPGYCSSQARFFLARIASLVTSIPVVCLNMTGMRRKKQL